MVQDRSDAPLVNGSITPSLPLPPLLSLPPPPQIALVRLEQLAPFPFDLVCRELRRYPNAEFVWCQEEPMNMGAYFHVQPRLVSCMK